MNENEALARVEALLTRLDTTRERLEVTEDPEVAIEVLAELAEIAREVETELNRAKREAETSAHG